MLPPKVTQEASRATTLSIKSGLKLEFLYMLKRFGDPKSDPKITQQSILAPGRPRDPKDRPEASGKKFWSRLGPILERCWNHFRAMLGPSLEHILKPAASPLLL